MYDFCYVYFTCFCSHDKIVSEFFVSCLENCVNEMQSNSSSAI
jgi:hypothetical protein